METVTPEILPPRDRGDRDFLLKIAQRWAGSCDETAAAFDLVAAQRDQRRAVWLAWIVEALIAGMTLRHWPGEDAETFIGESTEPWPSWAEDRLGHAMDEDMFQVECADKDEGYVCALLPGSFEPARAIVADMLRLAVDAEARARRQILANTKKYSEKIMAEVHAWAPEATAN